jgi:hypothetical protein
VAESVRRGAATGAACGRRDGEIFIETPAVATSPGDAAEHNPSARRGLATARELAIASMYFALARELRKNVNFKVT